MKPKAGVSDDTYRAVLSSVGAAEGEREAHDLYRKALVPEGQEQAIADSLATHPLIEWAQPDRVRTPQSIPLEFREVSGDPSIWIMEKWGDEHTDHRAIRSFEAWDVTHGAGQVIAVIDSGIDETDPNLIGQTVPGWNFVFGDADTSSSDHRVCLATNLYGKPIGGIKASCHHGTSVARTAVALADNEGPVNLSLGGYGYHVGVAPEAKVMPLVAIYDSEIVSALARAADKGIKVANISLGGTTYVSPLEINAAAHFRTKGGLVINGAGNTGNADQQPASAEAAFLFVAATQSGWWNTPGGLTGYSNRGPSIDLCAPEFRSNGGGTSNAAPAVAAAALVWSVNPAFTNVEVEQILKDAAATNAHGYQDCAGKFLDAGGAVRLAVERAGAQGAADALPPRVEFQDDSPPVVSGVATVDVWAGDDRGLAKMVLKVDGQVLGEDLTPPYQFVLDGAALLAGGSNPAP